MADTPERLSMARYYPAADPRIVAALRAYKWGKDCQPHDDEYGHLAEHITKFWPPTESRVDGGTALRGELRPEPASALGGSRTAPEPSDVERVAEALWNEAGGPANFPWSAQDEATRDYYRDLARSAVAALGGSRTAPEPSEAAHKSYERALWHVISGWSGHDEEPDGKGCPCVERDADGDECNCGYTDAMKAAHSAFLALAGPPPAGDPSDEAVRLVLTVPTVPEEGPATYIRRCLRAAYAIDRVGGDQTTAYNRIERYTAHDAFCSTRCTPGYDCDCTRPAFLSRVRAALRGGSHQPEDGRE